MPTCLEPAGKANGGGNCRRADDPGFGSVRHAQAHGRCVEPLGQGVGAWSWVNRDGQGVVNDMAPAGMSLVSLRPRPAALTGWAIRVFRILVRVFRSGFARGIDLAGSVPGFVCECFRTRTVRGCCGWQLFTSRASRLRHWKRLFVVAALNSRQINHLQRTTGVEHYRQLRPPWCFSYCEIHVQCSASGGCAIHHCR